jgi:hypothetical protein
MTMRSLAKLFLLLVLVVPAAQVSAQVQNNIQGRIDSVMLDDGVIVINGRQLAIREADLVITYQGEPIRAFFLTEGLTVFYSTRADGSVSEITLIGPASILDNIEKH